MSYYPRGEADRDGPLFLPSAIDGKKEVVMGLLLALAAPVAVHFACIGYSFPPAATFLGYLAITRGNRKGWWPIVAAPFSLALALFGAFLL